MEEERVTYIKTWACRYKIEDVSEGKEWMKLKIEAKK
jgi:hypothetical protein